MIGKEEDSIAGLGRYSTTCTHIRLHRAGFQDVLIADLSHAGGLQRNTLAVRHLD